MIHKEPMTSAIMMNGSAIRTGACLHWNENPRTSALPDICTVELYRRRMLWPLPRQGRRPLSPRPYNELDTLTAFAPRLRDSRATPVGRWSLVAAEAGFD